MEAQETIKKKAKEKGITIEKIAKRLGVSKPTLYRKMKDNDFTYREEVKLINMGVL